MNPSNRTLAEDGLKPKTPWMQDSGRPIGGRFWVRQFVKSDGRIETRFVIIPPEFKFNFELQAISVTPLEETAAA